MTGSNPDPRTPEDDLDPTGVRALLANLPDPGPMPDDLMARISQSLELEQRRRAAQDESAAVDHRAEPAASAQAGGGVVSLDAARARRRPGRTVLWLGGAAAVAMVATLSVNQLVDGDGNDNGVAAQVPHSSANDSDSADEAADADGGADSAAQGETGDAAAGDDGLADEAYEPPVAAPEHESQMTPGGDDAATAQQITTASGTVTLSASGWADTVTAWLSTDPTSDEAEFSSQEAADCLSVADLDTRFAPEIVVAQAIWDGEPGLLVVTEGAANSTGWVLSPDCTEVLSGPVPLG